MAREVVEIAGPSGGGPIATAARLGDMLFSSTIPGVDSRTGKLGDGAEEQFDLAFRNARTLVERAGLSPDHVGHLTVFINDASYRPHINKPWLELFPHEDRPARKTTHADLAEGCLVQLQVFAMANARRQPLEIPGLAHRDPLPMSVRIGNVLFSSVLGGDDPKTGQRCEGEAQLDQVFQNMQTLTELAGGSAEDVAHVWVFLSDFDSQPAMVKTWLEFFPEDGNRPARKTFPYELGRGTLIQMQFTAVLGAGSRRNFEIPGIGHHDPIPLGATTGQLFYSSGIDGRDPVSGGTLVSGAERQADQAFANLAQLMGIAGASQADVGHVTALIADQGYAPLVQAALQRQFPNPADRPALNTMLLGVKGRDTLVQLHAIGVV